MYKEKRIGLFIPNLQSGGAERVLSTTSKLLSENGYEVYFFLYNSNNIDYNFSGKLIDLNIHSSNNILMKMINRVKRISKLSYYKRKYNLSVVISFLYSANVVNYFSSGKADKILSCRGYGDFKKNGNKYAKMFPKINKLIVQTHKLKQDFIDLYDVVPNKIEVLHNPFNIGEIGEKSGELIDPKIDMFLKNHRTMCTTGSFKKDKGYWHLIKSFIEVKKTVTNAGLIFIGARGEMEAKIKKMAQNSGYANDILFLGYQSNPYKYISKCDLYVCSSLYEGFPNAIVEAMASGTPVISTDCLTGPREILTSHSEISGFLEKEKKVKYGILVPTFDENISFDTNLVNKREKIMARAIIKIFLDKKLSLNLSELGQKRAKEFSETKYLQNFIRKII